MAVKWRAWFASSLQPGLFSRKDLFRRDQGAVIGASAHSRVQANLSPDRIDELDGLRGVACLLILVYHVMPYRLPWGWAAVDLFFVLSGYLITSIVLQFSAERHFLFNFYMRRGLRIWPVYFLAILIMAAAVPLLPRPHQYAGLPSLLTYTQNVALYWSDKATVFSSYLEHTWSLAIEEQFYLVWPPLVAFVGRRGVFRLAIALVLASIAARMTGFSWLLLLARGDGLALGSMLAALPAISERQNRLTPPRQVIFGTIIVASLGYLVTLLATGGMPPHAMPRWPSLTLLIVNLLACGIVGLVLCARGSPRLWMLRRPRLVRIGKLSYGLYMYHYIILCLSDDAAQALGLGGRPLWREALNTALIFGVAALSWRYFERPILALKARFPYRAPAGNQVPGRDQGESLGLVPRRRESRVADSRLPMEVTTEPR
jgi:peptidoglycan/LPS O-acetylase OafA/YrhL